MIINDQTYYIYISIYLHVTRISAIVLQHSALCSFFQSLAFVCGQNISVIYKNIYLLYIHNIIIIITNITLHTQYLKVYYKSSIILYYKSYAILGLVTSFHPCTTERDHNIFYRIA